MEFNTMVRDIIIEGDTVKGIITDKDETYYAPEMVSAIGREGSDWFSHICGNHGIQTQVGTVDIGVRVEVRDEVMKFLNENLYEAKLVYYTPTFDDKVRTFCTNPFRGGGHRILRERPCSGKRPCLQIPGVQDKQHQLCPSGEQELYQSPSTSPLNTASTLPSCPTCSAEQESWFRPSVTSREDAAPQKSASAATT